MWVNGGGWEVRGVLGVWGCEWTVSSDNPRTVENSFCLRIGKDHYFYTATPISRLH